MNGAGPTDDVLEELRRYLASLPRGAVAESDKLDDLLSGCWNRFVGSDEAAMTADKVERMESVRWDPPRLTFEVERHGALVMGSTKAERHRWTLDMDKRTAEHWSAGFRQVYPAQRRLDVRLLAEEIFRLIVERSEDPRLRWNEDGSVRVLIGQIISKRSAVPQTIQDGAGDFEQHLIS